MHSLDLFYMGICYFELQQYDEAIKYFDRSISNYEKFADAKFYKVISLRKTNNEYVASKLLLECERDLADGFTINEDNAKYEKYPYQINKEYVEALKH